jgi:ribonuclease E
MATCPDCEFEDVDTEDLEQGDAVSCPECGRKLVLGDDGGLEFVDAADDLEDDDDDEDDEDDDDDDDVDDLDEDAEEEEEVDE